MSSKCLVPVVTIEPSFVSVSALGDPRKIPRPAGESAGLRDDCVREDVRMRAKRAIMASQKTPFDALRLLRAGYKRNARLA